MANRPLTRNRSAFALDGATVRPRAARLDTSRPVGRWPSRRHPGDLLRLLGGLTILVLASIAAHLAHPTVVETNLFRLINELPTPVGAPFLGVMQLGALGAVPLLALAALLLGRHRLSALVFITGTAAWAAAKVIQYLVDEEPPALRLARVVLHGNSAPGLAFPASHVAVTAALATVAAPYLSRSARRSCWLVVALIGIARIYVGLHLPIDVIGGLAVGWMLGSTVNLVVGVPARGPSTTQLRDLLRTLGLQPGTVEPVTTIGDRHLCRTGDGGSYLVKTIDWNGPDQDWLYGLWRLVAFRELHGPTLPGSPDHRADHEAHLALLAQRGGVRTPALVAIRHLGKQASLVVRQWVEATPVSDLPDGEVTDSVLADAWRQLDAVHNAGILHRNLRAEHLLVDAGERVWVTGWGAAEAGTDPDEQSADVAELAVVLTARAGPERTVHAAAAVLGAHRMSASLPHLEPLALAPPVRRLTAARPDLLASLRDEVAALEGRPTPHPLSPARVAASNLFPVAAIAIAVYVLLPRLAQTTTGLSAFRAGGVPWLLMAGGAAAVTYLMAAVALIVAGGLPLAVGRTYAVQLAGACANRVVPAGLGAAATNIRYLELAGLDRPTAAGTVISIAGVGFGVHATAVAAAAWFLHAQGPMLHVPSIVSSWPVILAASAVLTAAGWAAWARRLHRPAIAWVRTGSRGVRATMTRHPWRIVLLAGTSAAISGCYVLALAASLRAFGVQLGLGPVAAVYLGGSAVAAVVPVPGGVGPFEAAAVTALSAYGVAPGPAVAAVIAYRLITYWLPVAPGALSLHVLRRSGAL